MHLFSGNCQSESDSEVFERSFEQVVIDVRKNSKLEFPGQPSEREVGIEKWLPLRNAGGEESGPLVPNLPTQPGRYSLSCLPQHFLIGPVLSGFDSGLF